MAWVVDATERLGTSRLVPGVMFWLMTFSIRRAASRSSPAGMIRPSLRSKRARSSRYRGWRGSTAISLFRCSSACKPRNACQANTILKR